MSVSPYRLGHGAAAEVQDALQLFVVEEVVEAPNVRDGYAMLATSWDVI
jgi:hypothetical protein